MTVWAGYYLRDPHLPSPSSLIDELRGLVSRRPQDSASVVPFTRGAIVYVETGAFDTSSLRCDAGVGATLVAGEPLLADGLMQGRAADIARLHDAWNRGDFSATARSVGCFAGLHFNERSGSVALIADKLGVRPIYYAVTDDVVYFAGALRVLEGLRSLPKVMDVRGALETLALGYPLADRTAYRDIYAIRDADVVLFENRAVRRSRYWNIAAVPEEKIQIAQAAETVHALFSRAVDRRLGSDTTSVAFLSGGLDSRCLVAELVARGVKLHTFNFATDGTKDQILGDAFAGIVQSIHTRIPRPPDPVRWSMTMADVWGASTKRATLPPERPGLIWSGDGGSVGLGFVGVYASVIALLRAGKRDEAVTRYFAEHEIAVPIRVFRRDMSAAVRDLVHQGTREAFDEVRCEAEPGRELYFFRMVHDQRRHLTLHFEDVDLHRLEFHLPFYDYELIEAVAAVPADFGVGHRLYNEALKFFPSTIQQVAWQTYPGHEPCPIPLPASAIDQWGDRQKDIVRRQRRRSIVGETARVLMSGTFPTPLLDRRYLLAASVAHWLGVGDYAYAVDYANAFTDMYKVANGRWTLTPNADGGG